MFMSCYCTIVNIKYVIDLININDNKLNDGFLNILLYAAGKLSQGGLLWSSLHYYAQHGYTILTCPSALILDLVITS